MTIPTSSEIFIDREHWLNPFSVSAAAPVRGQLDLGFKVAAIAAATVAGAVFAALSATIILKASIVAAAALSAAIIVAVAAVAAVAVVTFFGVSAAIKAHVLRTESDRERSPSNRAPEQPVPPLGEVVIDPVPAPAAPIPIATVRPMQGLPNVGASCWLNSVLKFMATSVAYDQVFEIPLDCRTHDNSAARTVQLTHVQTQLRNTIRDVRAGNALADQTCRDLRLAMRAILPGCERGSQDAVEFFEALLRDLKMDDSGAKLERVGLDASMPVGTEISLFDLFAFRDEPLQAAPEILSIDLVRGESQLPIHLGDDGTILLPVDGERHRYRLEAALKNTGGHWVFYERKNDGRVVLHDDLDVLERPLLDMKRSHLFRFRHVGRESVE